MGWNDYNRFPHYVTIAERKEKIAKKLAALTKKNKKDKKNTEALAPIVIEGRLQAKTFWGKAWFQNIKSYADYTFRIERGRSYVSSGAVIDLKIQAGEVHALVCGTRMYTVHIKIAALLKNSWRNLIQECSGSVSSLVEILQGKFSQHVMQIVTHPSKGLFPQSCEINFNCSCPDVALMCKHVSATLYGIGLRLDADPKQLFLLRKVDPTDLLLKALQDIPLVASANTTVKSLEDDLSQVFGIDLGESSKTIPSSSSIPRAAQQLGKTITTIATKTVSARKAQKKPRLRTAARTVTEGALYKHYKGGVYQIIRIAYSTEGKALNKPEDVDDSAKLVIYKSIKPTKLGEDIWWVRPYTMFIENVVINGKKHPRFTECQTISSATSQKTKKAKR